MKTSKIRKLYNFTYPSGRNTDTVVKYWLGATVLCNIFKIDTLEIFPDAATIERRM